MCKGRGFRNKFMTNDTDGRFFEKHLLKNMTTDLLLKINIFPKILEKLYTLDLQTNCK